MPHPGPIVRTRQEKELIESAAQRFVRLQTRRAQPFADVRAGFRLARLPQGLLTRDARGKQFGFLSQTPCLSGQAVFKLVHSGETASLLLHWLLHSKRKASGCPRGVLATYDCKGWCGDFTLILKIR
jgi:hypothetical protein